MEGSSPETTSWGHSPALSNAGEWREYLPRDKTAAGEPARCSPGSQQSAVDEKQPVRPRPLCQLAEDLANHGSSHHLNT